MPNSPEPQSINWSGIVSIIALLQVWAIALWKKYVRKGRILLYEAGNIEISFSIWGPSIAILGTLRAINKDVFVDNITMTITRLRDNAQQSFAWKAFRSPLLSITGRDDIKVEAANSILIRQDNPYKYHIFFASDSFANDYRSDVRPYTELWENFIKSKLTESAAGAPWKAQTTTNNPADVDKLFGDFLREALPSQIWARINNTFFWHAGDYRVDMVVSWGEPQEKLARLWQFSIDQKEESDLRLNIIACMREIIKVPHFYNYIYKTYRTS